MLARPSLPVLALLLVATALVSTCGVTRTSTSAAPAVSAAGPGVTPTPTPAASPTSTPTPTALPTTAAGQGGSGIPTACLNLGPNDCQRAGDLALGRVDASAGRVIYLQVGPFGCANGERCPATLDARPEGDVIVEFDGAPAVGIHIRSTGGALSGEPIETFGVTLEPTPADPVALGPQPFDLGHCGLYSGIDLGGSWWDPVGPIDADHPDAINAATGVLTVVDPDHATYLSQGGLSVQLIRRDGAKHLPMCM